jgi:hypothetical protein
LALQKRFDAGDRIKNTNKTMVTGAGSQNKSAFMTTSHHFGEQQSFDTLQGGCTLNHSQPSPKLALL